MISYDRNRRSRSDRYHDNIVATVEQAMGVRSIRQSTLQEDLRGIDHWFTGEMWDAPDTDATFQFKCQFSTDFETWTVQRNQWQYDTNFYAFAHIPTRKVYIIDGETLKSLPRSLYDGPKTNQPFYYGQLQDLVWHGAVVADLVGVAGGIY